MTALATPRRYPTLSKSGFVVKASASGSGQQLADYTSAFEGASLSTRMGSWGLRGSGPNLEIDASLYSLRERSRELVRNSPLADGAMDTWASQLVGPGIVPRFVGFSDEDTRQMVRETWDDWVEEADADGRTDFYGLQYLIAQTLFQSGECLAVFRPRSLREGLTVPLQIQIIEPDHLDGAFSSSHEIAAPLTGNPIRMGIEFSRTTGRRVAYWMSRRHPGDGMFDQPVRIPAELVMHIYRARRPGQLRGIPELSSVIVKMHDLDQYTDAELVRKKTAALFAGFIENPDAENSMFDTKTGNSVETGDEYQMARLDPGIMQELRPGQKVHFSEPADVGSSYLPWIQQQMRDIARGMGITYEQLTGDLSGVNFTSIRAGLLEFRRRITVMQTRVMVHQFCRPVQQTWMRFAVLSGALDLPDFDKPQTRRKYMRTHWRPPAWEWVQPDREGAAAAQAIRDGLTSRESVASERGEDVGEIDRQQSRDNDRARTNGLRYDTDTGEGNGGKPVAGKPATVDTTDPASAQGFKPGELAYDEETGDMYELTVDGWRRA